jgi:motility quorum-sensing regulator / GCU-specific mRNA interferase toxin
MGDSTPPKYDLEWIQDLVRTSRYLVTETAALNAFDLEFTEDDIVACILRLDDGDFYKTMESHSRKGFFQDVYRPTYCNVRIYLKVQVDSCGAVVIQFKADTSAPSRGGSR